MIVGDPDALLKIPGKKSLSELEGWTRNTNLKLLNLMYAVGGQFSFFNPRPTPQKL